MSVTKLFWTDPYLARLQTKVVAVDENQVWLRETIFFAFSGGQESDSGTIGGHRVTQADKDGLDIVYTLDPSHDLNPGDPVEVLIDWNRRYGLMRHHFAAEMVLQLVYKHLPMIERVGAHISPEKARIDFSHKESLAGLLHVIEAETVDLVVADHPIITDYSDEATQRRYWEVKGFARMACGGTHPRTTAEIGQVRLKRKNQGKGIERIEITLADSTLIDRRHDP